MIHPLEIRPGSLADPSGSAEGQVSESTPRRYSMTATIGDVPPVDDWTTDDLDSLPDDGIRRGIGHYWLIEIDGGIRVQTYQLDPEDKVYQPSGTFTDF
jgi:hypothetical protein